MFMITGLFIQFMRKQNKNKSPPHYVDCIDKEAVMSIDRLKPCEKNIATEIMVR